MPAGCWKGDSTAVCERLAEGEVVAPINPGDESAGGLAADPIGALGCGLKTLCRALRIIIRSNLSSNIHVTMWLFGSADAEFRADMHSAADT